MATDSSLWVNNGGIISSPKLSDYLRFSAQPLSRFRAFADAKEAFGKNIGNTFNWDKIANVSTGGKALVETSTMPISSQTITQGTLTINEFGNSIPFTFKLDTLSKFKAEEMIDKGLKDDMVKTLDFRVGAQFDATPLYYVGSSTATYVLTTNGTATATNTSVLNTYHILNMKLELEKRNVPMFDGDTYAMICSLEALRSLEGAIESVQQYSETGYQRIAAGEVGMVHGVRMIKDGNASRYTKNFTTGATTLKSWTGANSLDAYMFGQDTVVEAVATPEEIRAKEVTDYGRSKGMAWYFMGDWKIVWDDEPNARIIKWASA
jgi:N4-gp56 family major capsid protein